MADPFASVSAATVGSVVVAFRIAAAVAVRFDFVVLRRVTVVTHEEDDGVVPQASLVKFFQDFPDVFVGRRDKGSVGSARLLDALVHLEVPLKSLLGIVRNVEGGVEEEGFVVAVSCLVVEKTERAVDHQVRKKRVRMKDLGRALEQIVKTVAVKEEVRVVVDETVADAKELIEALALRADVLVGSQVPLAVESGLVAGFSQSLCQSDFFEGHECALGSHVPLAPGIYATPLRMPPGHQCRPRRAADRVSVRCLKPHPVHCQAVYVRRVQISRPVTPGIERSLVIGKQDDNVGFIGAPDDGGRSQENQQRCEAKHREFPFEVVVFTGDAPSRSEKGTGPGPPQFCSKMLDAAHLTEAQFQTRQSNRTSATAHPITITCPSGPAKATSRGRTIHVLPVSTDLPASGTKVSERRQTGSLTLKPGTHKLLASPHQGCEGRLRKGHVRYVTGPNSDQDGSV